LGDNIPKVGWPACGEIDIMEFVGKTPDKVHGTLHWKHGGHQSKGGNQTVKEPWADFHVYAVEWSADKMDFFFDETKYLTIPLSTADDGANNAFRKPHHIKMNLALGGGWGGKIDDSILPQRFVVKYVRVYEKVAPDAEGGGGEVGDSKKKKEPGDWPSPSRSQLLLLGFGLSWAGFFSRSTCQSLGSTSITSLSFPRSKNQIEIKKTGLSCPQRGGALRAGETQSGGCIFTNPVPGVKGWTRKWIALVQ